MAPLSHSWLRGNGVTFSTFSTMLAIGLSHMVFIMLRYIPSISSFFMKVCIMFNFVKGFFHV
jgi:hypothetical protein